MTSVSTFIRSAAFFLTLYPLFAIASEDAHDRTTDIFGEPFGLSLILGAEKACTHVDETREAADPNRRILLLSNESLTQFYSEACDGFCSFVQTNNAVSRCRTSGGIDQCIVYGAIYQGEVYDVSVDAYGGSIRADCSK